MRDSGGEQSQGIQALAFNCFLGGATAFRDIAQNNGVANLVARSVPLHIFCPMLDDQRHDVEVDETIRWIKNFEIARHWPATSGEGVPIQSAHPLIELLANGIFGVQPEKFAGGI